MKELTALLNSMPGALAQGLIWGIVAIGVYITYRVLDIADLSVDGSLTTGAAVCVMLIRAGLNPWLTVFCAILSGVLAGMVTGLLHTKAGIPVILAGILTQLALYSVNLRIMLGKANTALSVDKYPLLVSQRYVREALTKNPLPLLVVIIAALILLLYWFFGTERGCALRATGANQTMAKAQGINAASNQVIGIAISNGLVALGGALLAQYQGSADINMGRGAIVIGLASVTIGEVLFGKKYHGFALLLTRIVLGAVVYYLILQIVLRMGLDTNDLKLFTAVVVAIFLGVPGIRARHPKKAERSVAAKC